MPAAYDPLIAASTLADPLRAVTLLGGDVAALCRKSGIPAGGAAGGDRISLRTFVSFCEHAAEDLRMPDFGWRVGGVFDLRNLGAVGESILAAPTLGAGLTLFRTAFACVQSDSELRFRVEGDEARLEYRILDLAIWPRRQDAELTLAVLHALVRRASGDGWQARMLSVEHADTALTAPGVAPGATVRARAPINGFVFPARLLGAPLARGASPGFRHAVQTHVRSALREAQEAPVAVQVRRALIRRFGAGAPNQTEVAAALGMSRRTLRRRLADEGLRFSTVLAECRMEVARRILEEGRADVRDVAQHLGYSEVSAFERAFKKVVGETPARYRGRHAVA
ncbi:AraC-like transcriptional regulator QhpR [Roseivivax sp. CAU 1761]